MLVISASGKSTDNEVRFGCFVNPQKAARLAELLKDAEGRVEVKEMIIAPKSVRFIVAQAKPQK